MKSRPVSKKSVSQYDAVKNYLLKKKKITSWEAIQLFGATRLSGIIYKLRWRDSLKITTDYKTVKNRFEQATNIAVYKLEK